MPLLLKEEKITDKLIADLNTVLPDHWKEVANHQKARPLDIDWDVYKLLNKLEALRVFVVRDNDKLIGYTSFFIGPHPHYKTWVFANNDVYYLDPKYRGKDGIGIKFFREVEKWLKSLGVQLVAYQDKVHRSHTKFFTGMGYKIVEQVYEKMI